MPECIVCKADYTLDEPCPRCRSDNTPWDDWRAEQDETRDGIDGLVLSYFITLLALAFGLIGVGGFWNGVTLAAQLLATAVTVFGCFVVSLVVYKKRYYIRERELLNRVRRGYGALLNDTRLRALVAPAISLLLVLAIAYALVSSDLLWKLAQWWFLDPAYLEQVEQQEIISDATAEGKQPEEADGLRKRIRQALPFILMGTYVALMLSLTYSVSLVLAMDYAREMNEALPQPIFLRNRMLARIVRREAELLLGRVPSQPTMSVWRADRDRLKVAGKREITQTMPATGGQQLRDTLSILRETEHSVESGDWAWDRLERTKDGGIKLRALKKSGIQTVENVIGERTERSVYVTYEVKADPWGRITSIARVEEKET